MGIRANDPHNDYLIELVRASLLHTPLPPMPADCSAAGLSRLIFNQHLVNLVYPVLSQHEELNEVRSSLERAYMLQIPKITNQDLETAAWLDAAEAAGIDCIPLKGYWLRKLYPSPFMRSATDFDVLLRDMDRNKIKPWMESMGYEAEDEKEISHHDNYIKKPWMYMELHKHLMKPRPGSDVLERKIWEHSTLVPGRKHIYQMSPEDFYIFHLLHMYKHFVDRGSGLKSVIDIYVYRKSCGAELDQAYLQQELKTLGIDVYAQYMEKLTDIWLGDAEADEDSKLVTDYIAGCGMFGNNETHHALRIANSQRGSLAASKFRYRLKVLFPGVAGMQRHFPSVTRFPFLLPFYWVARIFKSVFVKKKKASSLKFDHISDQEYSNISHILMITGATKL